MMFALTVATLVTPLLAHNSLRKNCHSTHREEENYDRFGNAKGENHDFGGSGFDAQGQKILIIDLLNKSLDYTQPEATLSMATAELEDKGFNVITKRPDKGTMKTLLDEEDPKQLWIIDGNYSEQNKALTESDIEAIKTRYDNGSLSVFLLADNSPYFDTVNRVAKELIDNTISVSGNHPGNHVVRAFDPDLQAAGFYDNAGYFKEGDVTKGIHSLFTGYTIADIKAPSVNLAGTFSPVIYDYDVLQKPFIVAATYEETDSEGTKGLKRLIVDGAFTRILDDYYEETSGTKRYIMNSAVWLSKLVQEDSN